MKDYYFILGVASTARNNEIKEAFRKLCLKYHPDRTTTSPHKEERYIEICEAYRILSNRSKRAAYDRKRENLSPKVQGIRAAIYPEINTSYKGLYPWLAAFAIIIVAAVALLFNFSSVNIYTESEAGRNEPAPLQPASPPPAAKQLASADTVQQPATVVDTIPSVVVNTDSIKKYEKLTGTITTTLDQNTMIAATSSDDRNYKYSFNGNKLIVSFSTGPKEQASKKQMIIPVSDIRSVYYYAGKLWINNSKNSIRVSDSKTGGQTRTNFFSVRIDPANAANVEKTLTDAFAGLKNP